MQKSIRIRGARQHNLRNLDLRLPRDRWTVITGVSGSGKSSLALDTLYAEGYRKYMESLSTRARQVLDQMERPEVDFIEGLSPVIAVEQHSVRGANPRSTVASLTEIADYARVLWAAAGQPHCPLDGAPVRQRSIDDCVERVFAEPEGSRIQVLAPRLVGKPSLVREELGTLQQKGYSRVRVDGRIARLEEDDLVDRSRPEQVLELVVDRLVLRPDQRGRLADSLELAFAEGAERAIVLVEREREGPWEELALSRAHACTECGTVYPAPTPRLFSWNSPEGACPQCRGVGEVFRFDPELLVPDPSLSVRKGALKPWRLGPKKRIIERNALLRQLAEQWPFDPTLPWADLPEEIRRVLLFGSGERTFAFKTGPGNRPPEVKPFPGVLPDLEESLRTTRSEGWRARMVAYQRKLPCTDCGGARLAAYPRHILLAGRSFPDFLRSPVGEAIRWAGEELQPAAGLFAPEAVEGLAHRLRFLGEVGLGYLTLDRPFATLSGGEAQRTRLATQLGMGLVGVIYVLDEPSIGLHPVDNQRLLRNLAGLRDRGNTVVVVEHDEDMMRAADHLVELGPGAGREGGAVVYEGPPEGAAADPASRTGAYLGGRESLRALRHPLAPAGEWLTVTGARAHNLRDLEVSFPVGRLSVVCGVSGSGKSTLVHDILAAEAARRLNGADRWPAAHAGLRGLEHFEKVVEVDQSPIGRSPRSNPATFTGLFTALRQLFAKVPLSRIRGYGPSRFSFNVAGGRCEHCKGDGMIALDMQFMSDVFVECPSCRGQRYNRETLEVRYRGHNIAEVLAMTVEEAREIFQRAPHLRAKLDLLHEVGLGYVKLGQSATTLSGGEAQRLKLADELSRRQQGRSLYLLDEPSTGLHWDDLQRLVQILYRLREAGNTILLVEHHLDLVSLADWVVELGPGGGTEGGQLLFAGPPENWAEAGDTPTRRALAGPGRG